MNASERDAIVDEAVAEYMRRVDAGESVDRAAFVARHPHVATELESYFRMADAVGKMAGPEVGRTQPTGRGSTQSELRRQYDTVAPSQAATPAAGNPVSSRQGASTELDLPETFGRYRIVKLLGRGAMGEVYLARDTRLGRDVALKTSNFEADVTGELRERFYREAQLAAQLHHPNICPVFDVDCIDGRHVICMGFIDGRPLSAYIDPKKPTPERQALTLIRKLALALQVAHDAKIIHRDLKPGNVMIDAKGEPIITDFGLARGAGSPDQARLTQSGMIVGSPAYMSPEQVEGEPDLLTPATDQYSLGVILYEVLTAQLPFHGTITQIIAAIATREPTPAIERRPGLDPRIDALCRKMMSKKVADRFQSMKAVADEAATILKTPRTDATSTTGLPKGPVAPSPEAPEDAPRAEAARADAAPSKTEGVSKAAESRPVAKPVSAKAESSKPNLAKPATGRAAGAIPPRRTKSAATSQATRAGASVPVWRKPAVLAGIVAGALLLAAATVLFFKSGDALVKVTIHDESIRVTLQGKTLSIDDAHSPVKVTPGAGRLSVEYGGHTFETPVAFTLKKGDNPTVVVELVEGNLRATFGEQTLLNDPVGGARPGAANAVDDTAAAARNLTPSEILLSPDWEWSSPENLGPAVNKKGRESSPSITTDELTLVFLRDGGIFLSRRKSRDEPFPEAAKLPPPISTKGASERSVGVSGDGLSIVFASDRLKSKNGDIYLADRKSLDDSFGEPRRLIAPVHSNGTERSPQLTLDALEMIVTSTRAGGRGSADLYRFTRTSRDATFTGGENLGPLVNTDRWDTGGAMTSDGLILFRSLLGPSEEDDEDEGGGRMSICVRRKRDEPFQEVRPLGPPFDKIQTRVAVPSVDGRRLYFGAKLDGGWGRSDLWMCRRVPKQKPAVATAANAENLAVAPFDAAQAKAFQADWSKRTGVPVESPNSLGMKLVLIPPGRFTMGSSQGDDNEKPPHAVTISKPFLIGMHEVTQKEYEEIVGTNPSAQKGSDRPANEITWEEANAFCEKLTQREGKRYRLPTEAEWEFACRAGTTTEWSFGDKGNDIDQYGWHNGTSSDGPRDVGKKKPNPFGLFDMHGNVWEYCSDWFGSYVAEAAIDPKGPDFGKYRVFRGGSHYFPVYDSRSANRPDRQFPPKGLNVGFRVVREIEALQPPATAVAPFDAAKAAQHQTAWANHLGQPVEAMNSVGMKLRLIPPGEFLMGRVETDQDHLPKVDLGTGDKPQHRVRLTKPFRIGATEVTQKQWRDVMKTTPWVGQPRIPAEHDDAPASCMTLLEAIEFCEALGRAEGRKYRLPTDAEWEYACRAGTTTVYWFGNDHRDLDKFAQCRRNTQDKPKNVALKPANPFGLFDMHGNLGEFCNDNYGPFPDGDAVDPQGPPPKDQKRVVRGGAFWHLFDQHYRSAHRVAHPERLRNPEFGFRVVCEIDGRPAEPAPVAKPAVAATLPAGPPGAPMKWLAASIHDPAAFDSAAPMVNLVMDRSWIDFGDRLAIAARRRGTTLIASFHRNQFPAIEPRLFDFVERNRDVVAGVCLESPYTAKDGVKPDEFAAFTRRVKAKFPGLSIQASFVEMPLGMKEPLPPVPAEIDVLDVSFWFDMSPAAVDAKAKLHLDNWRKRAGDRPLLLRWVTKATFNASPGAPYKAQPGTILKCVELCEKHKLAGLIVEQWGPRNDKANPPFESDATALDEFRRTSEKHGFGTKAAAAAAGGSTSASVKPADPNETAPRVVDFTLFAQIAPDFVMTCAASPDGKLVAAGSNTATRIYDAAIGKQLHELDVGGKNSPRTLAFSPDGGKLLWGGWNQKIHLFDTASGAKLRDFEGNTGLVRSASFSVDGKRVLVGTQGKKVGPGWAFDADPLSRLWDVEKGTELKKHDGSKTGVGGQLLNDGKRAVSRSGNGSIVRMWDVETGVELAVFERDLSSVGDVVVSPDERHVAASLGNNVVLVWDVVTRQRVQRLEPASNPAFTPDGARIVGTSKDGASVRMWDVTSGRELLRVEKKLPDGTGRLVVLPPGDRGLLCTYQSGHVYTFPLDGK